VISRTTPNFWRAYARLDRRSQQAASRAFVYFRSDPGHNSLFFKKLRGHTDLWSVRISEDLRAVAHRSGDTVFWLWIGTHNEFDNLFS
jgi:hypothetical protein